MYISREYTKQVTRYLLQFWVVYKIKVQIINTQFNMDMKPPNKSGLTESERCQIIAFHTAGFSRNNISKTLGFSKTTITRTIQNNRDEKSTKTVLRSGRPGCLNHKSQQELKQIVRRNKAKSVPLLNE